MMEILRKIFLNKKIRLITKVTLAHVLTKVVLGMIFNNILPYYDYEILELMGFRPIDEILPSTIIFAQILRGILLGIVIWLIKDSIIGRKLAWLKLWVILLILGVFNTYVAAMGTIEGFVFLDMTRFDDLPIQANLSFFELLLQPLLFSIIVTYDRRIYTKTKNTDK